MLLEPGFAFLENHAADRNAIQQKRLSFAALPGRQVGSDRNNVGDSLAIVQDTHGFA